MAWIWYAIAAVFILDAFRMRRRLRSIPVLGGSGAEFSRPEVAFIAAEKAKLPQSTRMEATAYMQEHGIDLLDIVAADTPALAVLTLSQIVDPPVYAVNRVAIGFTSGFAMAASPELLARAGKKPPPAVEDGELAQLARAMRKYAGVHAGLAIAPGTRFRPEFLPREWPLFASTVTATAPPFLVVWRAILLGVLAAGLVLAPAAGLAALGVFHLQPLLTIGGLALRPRDLLLTVALRYPIEIWSWFLLLASRLRAARQNAERHEARRPAYDEMLANGTAAFFEPRRADCLVCKSVRLRKRIETKDLFQYKPGRFRLDECQNCGHVFQNPRLSAAGLKFYYSDFYSGLGGKSIETVFRARPKTYIERALSVKGLGQPTRWLDVGTGHGHFCCVAREAWPEARFDGLDISEGLDEGVRAGWIDRAYSGFISDWASQLKGEYDVVSLFHCLEHSPDPVRDLDAVWEVLVPGGLLVIEVPNPECRLGRLLGRFWMPYFQPQHLHLFNASNLANVLKEHGFETQRTAFNEAHTGADLFFCVLLAVGSISEPNLPLPWRARAGWALRGWNFAVRGLALPFAALALVMDLLFDKGICRVTGSNAFRVVARRVERESGVRGQEPGFENEADVLPFA
ncbi:MAG: class I SAM-dependent methyltransferase [Bryobacterales bacterium]|nr:class I SAM-dependent methyltransferase [Bryobacterales bacterium]